MVISEIKKHKSIFGLAIVFAFSFSLITQMRPFFMQEDSLIATENVDKIPKERLNAETIRPFFFGFEPLVADLLWIYGTVEMDYQLRDEDQYNLTYVLFHLATDLDPRFEALTVFGAGLLMAVKQGYDDHIVGIEDGQEILQKGWDFYLNRTEEWKHHSRYWNIPLNIGFNYYFEYKDIEKALPYYEFIANYVPEAPNLYRTFASHLYKELNREQGHLAVLENLLIQETLKEQLAMDPENEELKEKIRRKMVYLKGGKVKQQEVEAYIAQIRQKALSMLDTWINEYPYLTYDQFVSLHPNIYSGISDGSLNMLEITSINQGVLQ